MMRPGAAIGVDTGGTFTDLVRIERDDISVTKILSTPDNPADAIFDAIGQTGVDPSAIARFVHGTTVATNALIERTGSGVALCATQGFRDLLRIQRIRRPDHFGLHWQKPKPLVPRRLSFGVPERVLFDGTVERPLDEAEVARIGEELRERGEARAIAVSYLFSFVNPEHELRTREILREVFPEAEVSLSCEVLPRWREFERTSTTVIDAYLKPRVKGYLRDLERRCESAGIPEPMIVRSNGGVAPARMAAEMPAALVRSGPAGGVVAACHLGRRLGLGDLIAADMGGTSFEAALLPGSAPTYTNDEELQWGAPIAITMVDVRSIGAGGGSLAEVDVAGMLRVGPKSAGAMPGPACYGRGGTGATVTDSNVQLGRLPAAFQLAGSLELKPELAREALGRLGDQLGYDPDRVAHGIISIANNHMAQALRLVSTDRGYDTRDATLVAYGGAGPLHACELAAALRLRRVLVPRFPGALSALGGLLAEERLDLARTRHMLHADADVERIRDLFAQLEAEAAERLGVRPGEDELVVKRSIDARYVNQNWELNVDVPGGEIAADVLDEIATAFEREHERVYGYSIEGAELEFLTFRIAAVKVGSLPELPALPAAGSVSAVGRAPVSFDPDEGRIEVPLYWRDDLGAGAEIEGPAIVGQRDSTTVLTPGSRATVDELGNLLIEFESEESR